MNSLAPDQSAEKSAEPTQTVVDLSSEEAAQKDNAQTAKEVAKTPGETVQTLEKAEKPDPKVEMPAPKKPVSNEVKKTESKPSGAGKKTSVKVDTQEMDNESLVVHVDDTQNDLDADLISTTQESKTGADGQKPAEKKDEPKQESVAKVDETATSKVETKKETVSEIKETPEKPTEPKTDKKPEDKKDEKDPKSTAKRSVWFV